MGTIIGRHHQLARGPSRGSRAGLTSTLGCRHVAGAHGDRICSVFPGPPDPPCLPARRLSLAPRSPAPASITPGCDTPVPAPRQERRWRAAPAVRPELPAPAPKLPPFPSPPHASPWRPLCFGGTGSGLPAPRPRLKGGRRVKVQGKLRRARALGMRVASNGKGGAWAETYGPWAESGRGLPQPPAFRQPPEATDGRFQDPLALLLILGR